MTVKENEARLKALEERMAALLDTVEGKEQEIQDLKNQIAAGGQKPLTQSEFDQLEAEIEEQAEAMLREQTSGGKYKYRVEHKVRAYNEGTGKGAERQWASRWHMPPFCCDEPDPVRAMEIYKRVTRGRFRDPKQVRLVRVDNGKASCAF